MSFEPKIYKDNGGDRQVVANGGEIKIETGGKITNGGSQAAFFADLASSLEEAYTTGELDAEAEIIAAINATNAAVNALETSVNAIKAALIGIGAMPSS